jgi:hypothetical protein
MIVLLLVTQNESDLLRWNIRHHLEWGIDHVAVADNASTDSTADVAHEFGEQVSHRSFPEFLKRQGVRTAMLDDLRARHTVTWAGVADTDEFYWSPSSHRMRDLLDDVPQDIVGVNFDMKLYLPTELDVPDEPVFMSRAHRTGSSASPFHTSYRAGKSWYRAEWLTSVTDEHWCKEVPHEQYRHAEPAVHHYMVQDEDQFVQKVTRLISWAHPPDGLLKRRRWERTPEIERALPQWSAPFKKEWWGVYQQGGEPAVREYYRNVYTLRGDRLRRALADGSIVEDAGFSIWSRERFGSAHTEGVEPE